MKLSMLFVLLGIFQARADVRAQGSITLNMQQTEIVKVLNKIEKKGEFRFLYNYELASLKKKVDVSFNNTDLKTVLQRLFAGTDLTYKLLENNLVVVMAGGGVKQAIRITGTVTGPAGEPLAGVSVQVKGGTNGTSTGNKGEYAITAEENATLIFSYIGYADKEEPVNSRNVINVQLAASNKKLDEVVVIGYGSQRRKDVTGAVSTVTAADIANRPIVDAGEALQGKAAGVSVVSNSGKPGAGLTIRVRGSSSISAGNDPLYVVDGIPMTDISAFSPNDIESISILKDAASASIYGTRAANGVVVITTKKGVAGKSKISASVYAGISSPTKMLSVLNGKQYQDYANELNAPVIAVTDSMVAAANVNWPKEVFQNGNQQSYDLSVAGGSEKTQHFVSANYLTQKGIVKPAAFDRFTARANVSTKANNWLTIITSNVLSHSHTYGVTDNVGVANGGVVLSALETPFTVPKYEPDGRIGYNPLKGWSNPYGAIYGRWTRFTTDRLLSNLGADVKLLKGLVFQSRFGLDYQDIQARSYVDPFLTSNIATSNPSDHSQTTSTIFTWLSEQTLNYSATWGLSHFSALAGWTAQDSRTNSVTIQGSHLSNENRFLAWETGYLLDSIHQPGKTAVDDWALISYLGRVSYDFDGRYLFQANIRSDNSSKFRPGNRTAVFPSFSAGWRISGEEFMKKFDFISELKLRAGWGQNGNQEGIGSYGYVPLYNITVSNDSLTGSPRPYTQAPMNLTWEKSSQTNIGLDATLFNGRIFFSGDFYIKKTKDVLWAVPLLASTGFPNAPINGATMRNIGGEFLVSTRNIVKGDFRWTTDLTFSVNRNKVTSLLFGIQNSPSYGDVSLNGAGTPQHAISLATGYGLGEYYGYVARGVDPNTGHELYETKADTLSDNPDPGSRRLIGNAQPKFTYGMTNTVSYKNFDLTVFVQGSAGNKIYNVERMEAISMLNSANQSSDILRRWRKKGDVTDIPGVGWANNSLISTRFLENGSYLRFKTITLSYRFNPKMLDKIGLSAATLYVSGNNLITITGYKGFDPEVNSAGSPIVVNPNGTASTDNDARNISLGLDSGAYPQSKIFMVGLNVSLK
ncbi:MAG: TonB-dependent receptor [Bacteroidetes bacterium]|nr:TonB-dependent receptor [Bacteroidota bacterium]